MCYMNCPNEISSGERRGECRKVPKGKCPHEYEEDDYVPDADDYADYLRDQRDDR